LGNNFSTANSIATHSSTKRPKRTLGVRLLTVESRSGREREREREREKRKDRKREREREREREKIVGHLNSKKRC
jgi:3'-phosphoadenosine 5'-phosphosulfate sulfotransferase (PAPS reductase)/FAD synthetase